MTKLTYSLDTLLDAIHDTLAAAASLVRTEKYDEITDGMQDYPTLQVYPENNLGTSEDSQTHKLTLGYSDTIGHSVKKYTVHADLYAHQLGNIGEDMGRLVTCIDEFEDILDTQECPLFGQEEIISFTWSWSRVQFIYAGVPYVGARFVIIVEVGTNG